MYPWAMGTPTPKRIRLTEKKRGKVTRYYDPESGTFNQGAMGGLRANVRFKLDNLPQFLDAADEFYLDPATGVLFYRPGEGVNPNDETFELTRNAGCITLQESSHVVISGLRFSFTHDTTVAISSRDKEEGAGCRDITVRNCTFRDICQNGVVAGLNSIRGGGDLDDIRVTDCSFENVWDCAIRKRTMTANWAAE